MSTFFVNLSGPYGVETIDEVRGSRSEAEFLLGEYRLVYARTDSRVYLSSRSAANWREGA